MASVTCPSCGAPASVGARYCPHCATPLGAATAPPASGEGTSGWLKALVVALGVGLVAAVVVAVILLIGVGKASHSINNALTPKPGRPSGYHGPDYPGMLTQDRIAAGAGGQVALLGETIVAGDLKRTASIFGPTLCSPVTITNQSAATTDVGPAEWKLQQPNGIVETFAITGSLQGGQIAPGGTARGTVCFADTVQSGTYVLLWQPLLRAERGVWLLHL